MKRLLNIEYLILGLLWTSSLLTFSYALLKHYSLFTSDYLGLFGLLIVSIYAIIKPDKIVEPLLILLSIGLFNLMSFIYFYNVVFTFGISGLVSPGIQIYSLILLTILVIKKPKTVYNLFQTLFGQTIAEKEESTRQIKEKFKISFKELTEKEIDLRLKENLVNEAIEVLLELKEEKKRATTTPHTP